MVIFQLFKWSPVARLLANPLPMQLEVFSKHLGHYAVHEVRFVFHVRIPLVGNSTRLPCAHRATGAKNALDFNGYECRGHDCYVDPLGRLSNATLSRLRARCADWCLDRHFILASLGHLDAWPNCLRVSGSLRCFDTNSDIRRTEIRIRISLSANAALDGDRRDVYLTGPVQQPIHMAPTQLP
jgi:hypothetical protein